MKDIKFRAWHIKERKMYEVESINFFFGFAEIQWWTPEPDGTEKHNYKTVMFVDGITEKKEIELMQYTGLKDKNGKEIYEGDIIEGEIWNYLFGYYIKVRLVVKWDEAGYWSFENEEYEFAGGYLSDVKNVVVIGNIYQNPELLEEE